MKIFVRIIHKCITKDTVLLLVCIESVCINYIRTYVHDGYVYIYTQNQLSILYCYSYICLLYIHHMHKTHTHVQN